VNAGDIGRLQQLFGAFHQDWDLDAPTDDGIIARFIADHPSKDELRGLAALIEDFIESYRDDNALKEALLRELWCEYSPVSARDWLHHVAMTLRKAS
jgi:hypothetical protein